MSYIGNPLITAAFVTDQFSGTGSQTVYTTSVAPAGTAAVLVSVSGVLQDPTTYSVSGTTLTFTGAPPLGTGNISCRYLGIPASGVTTTAYRTVTEFTATAGQTVFTPPSYTVGFINVYRNGVRLGASDFTATNGTTVTLTSGASSGDLVTTESFYVSSVIGAIPAITGAVTSTYIANGAVGTAQIASSTTLTTPTLSSPTINGTYTGGTSLITSGTAQASTSGTSIDFTSIPSWVKRITVMFAGVSTNGTSVIQVQLGDSGGVETTGYLTMAGLITTTNNVTRGAIYTSGFPTSHSGGIGDAWRGAIIFSLYGSNLWVGTGTVYNSSDSITMASGTKTLTDTLDRVRITTVNGTDTFDLGSINILYE